MSCVVSHPLLSSLSCPLVAMTSLESTPALAPARARAPDPSRVIVSVDVPNRCDAVLPCSHWVTVTYADGGTQELYMFSIDIMSHPVIPTLLNDQMKQHFAEYTPEYIA